LNWACYHDHFDIVKFLIEDGEDIDNQTISYAINGKAYRIVDYLNVHLNN
jgi:hypothetical protein